jgi:hypothetical protein
MAINGQFNDLVTGRSPTFSGGIARASAAGRQGGYGSVYQDGTDDYVEIPSSPRFDSETGTIAFWWRPMANVANTGILARNGPTDTLASGFAFVHITSGSNVNPQWVARDSGNTTRASLDIYAAIVPIGRWVHLAVSYNRLSGGACRSYANGAFNTSTTSSADWAFNSQVIRIGRIFRTFYNNHNGNIDDLRWYDRILSDDEVRLLYIRSSQGYPHELNRLDSKKCSLDVPAAASAPVLKYLVYSQAVNRAATY